MREKWSKPKIKVLSTELDPDLKKVVVKKSLPYFLAPDTQKLVEDTIRASLHGSYGQLECRSRVARKGIRVVRRGGIVVLAGIEKSTSRTHEQETETKRSGDHQWHQSGIRCPRSVGQLLPHGGRPRWTSTAKGLNSHSSSGRTFDLPTEATASSSGKGASGGRED